MPKEKFWPATAVEGDGTEPTVTISWGNDQPGVIINGMESDRSGVNRMIKVLRKARDQAHGHDE